MATGKDKRVKGNENKREDKFTYRAEPIFCIFPPVTLLSCWKNVNISVKLRFTKAKHETGLCPFSPLCYGHIQISLRETRIRFYGEHLMGWCSFWGFRLTTLKKPSLCFLATNAWSAELLVGHCCLCRRRWCSRVCFAGCPGGSASAVQSSALWKNPARANIERKDKHCLQTSAYLK